MNYSTFFVSCERAYFYICRLHEKYVKQEDNYKHWTESAFGGKKKKILWGKRRKCWSQHFLLFPTMFLFYTFTNISHNSATFNISFENAFNDDESGFSTPDQKRYELASEPLLER